MVSTYQVFISFKYLDDEGQPTRDSILAQEVYEYLTDQGLTVFLSSISLEKTGVAEYMAEYKRAIDRALDEAEVMVVVGTSSENINSKWVRYEWDSFYADILSGAKGRSSFFTYVENVALRALPRTMQHHQVFQHPDDLPSMHRYIVRALASQDLDRAREAMVNGHHAEAVQHLSEQIDREPDNTEAVAELEEVSTGKPIRILPKSDKSGQLRDETTGRILFIGGLVLVAAGFTWAFFRFFVEEYFRRMPEIFLWWNIPVILLGTFLIWRGKQFIARSRPAELSDDTGPPVVYLRSFKEDASTAARVLSGIFTFFSFSTFEEQLAEATQPIGPLVALAQPRRALPIPGAARFRATDKEWQNLVAELLKTARLVIIRPGQSNALVWELEKVFQLLKPSQVLLLFHETSGREYRANSLLVEQLIGVSLPEFSGKNNFIAFDDDWQPYSLPLRAPFFRRSRYKSWRRLIHHALEPVFRDFGFDWHPAPISALKISWCILCALVVLIIWIIVITQGVD